MPYTTNYTNNILNVAVIAHVDHGKTTLVDKLLSQNKTNINLSAEDSAQSMDSSQLEKERGITIISKCAAIDYKGVRINLVDTPGHADFGGEVERVLNMVDGALLLVDAYEGPMPQTRFVTSKALALGLKIIVVINKIDRANCEPIKALNMVFDLLANLGASDEQLDFDTVYTSAKLGYAIKNIDQSPTNNLDILLDSLITNIKSPKFDIEKPFRMIVSDIQYDKYLGRLLLGRVHQGTLSLNQNLSLIAENQKILSKRPTKIFNYQGRFRVEKDEILAGDIALIGGFGEGQINDTVSDPSITEPLPANKVDLPTVSMFFRVNDSPFAGKEGKFCTSRQIKERLTNELQSNVALRLEETPHTDIFKISGRGELHLSILIENMRREGYEFAVSRPESVVKIVDNQTLEPFEELMLDVPATYLSSVIEELGNRRAEIMEISNISNAISRIMAHASTKNLFGLRSLILTLTKGEGILYHSFLDYRPLKDLAKERRFGVLISKEQGTASAYSIWKLEDRGQFFITPGTEVYQGMIIGQCNKNNDLEVNVCTTKKLTNVRASGKDDNITLTPAQKMSLEKSIEFIEDDELVEVTPANIRLRKIQLDPNLRKRKK